MFLILCAGINEANKNNLIIYKWYFTDLSITQRQRLLMAYNN